MSDGNEIVKIDLDKVDWRGSREFFESLTAALEKLDEKDESYDFTWVGKRKAIIEAGAPIDKTFRPDVTVSKDWDNTENLFIEGDNLDALKLLQESYLGKVKMIYIDPPYNTGRDFVYHDNFKASVDQYDEDTEYRDSVGNIQFKRNEKSNGRYHSDWLSMMYPRLKLARNLLANDGVVFISIDDNEQSNIKKLCDEIFGEDNFIAQIIVQTNPRGRSLDRHIAKTFEYVLVYAKQYEENGIYTVSKSEKALSEYNKTDEGGAYRLLELRNRNPVFNRGNRPNLYYPIYVSPDTGEISLIQDGKFTEEALPQNSEGKDGCWTWGKDKVAGESMLLFGKRVSTGAWRIYRKDYAPIEGATTKEKSLWLDSNLNHENGKEAVRALFGESPFDFPKSPELIKRVLRMSTKEDAIVLDFFCGSGTTAHSVMQLNAEDGGNRKWIMVQLPEEIDEKSEAHKAGYKTIPEISRERIRRAGGKIAAEHPDAKVDYGFRALTITDTNYKDVYKPAGQLQQRDLLASVDNVKEDRTDLDLLYGVLTQSAFELNRPISTTEIAGATIYQYDYFSEVSGLIACFAKDVPEEAIKAIAVLKPLTAVFRDSSFANSQAKVNLSEHFRILSPDTKVKVI